MDSKCIKKSTVAQLQALVDYMEQHPEFARGSAVYGSSKMTVEEQWIVLVKKLNALGPPMRSIAEWKKSWADLKSRTKKKIAENSKSLRETGGGLYSMNPLSELEQVVDRTLFLSKAAAPSGKVFGFLDKKSVRPYKSAIDECFEALIDSPPRNSKSVAVITPNRQQKITTQQQHVPTINSNTETTRPRPIIVDSATITSTFPKVLTHTLPNNVSSGYYVSTGSCFPETTADQLTQESTKQPLQRQKRQFNDSDDELNGCSSAKKRKFGSEPVSLIRRQLRVNESSAATAKEQVDATKTLAEATQAIAAAVQQMANAAEVQAEAAKKNAETQSEILMTLQALRSELAQQFFKK